MAARRQPLFRADQLLELAARATAQFWDAAQRERELWGAGLPVESDAGLALLERLACDPVGEVRRPARRRLGAVRELPWWFGKWRRDPTAGLAPDEVERLRPAFGRIVEILDTESLHGRGDE